MVPTPHRFEPYAVTPSISASSSSEGLILKIQITLVIYYGMLDYNHCVWVLQTACYEEYGMDLG